LNLDNSNFDTPSTTTSNRQYGTSKHRSKEAEEEVVCDWEYTSVIGMGLATRKMYKNSKLIFPLLRSKGKVKDKAQHAVILDKATSDKLYKDVQSYRLITVATLVDRLKINGSLARRCLADLEEKGQIKKVVGHSKLAIYSM
jgi:small subunit ribosomal protein S25e